MRYAAPVAMPTGLGEWLGAELEARGVEAASLYARAVMSILLHSEGELEQDRDPLELDAHQTWNPRAALELELRLERHNKESRRGRPSKKTFNKSNYTQHKHSGNIHQRTITMTTNASKSSLHTLRRRPHSWNGDEEELKKCAAIECLLSATDDDQWPVEKLVDELCTRLKLLQLEQNVVGKKRWAGLGSSAPDCFECPSSDSDSFTSVSSPEADQENYRQDFPPLEYLSDSDQGDQPVLESIWSIRQASSTQQSRVRFVRMTGTRLSPAPLYESGSLGHVPTSFGDTSEAYFGDCSRDSSLERTLTPPLECWPSSSAKGRLYERGTVSESQSLSAILNNAFKSLCQLHEENDKALCKPLGDLSDETDASDLGVGDMGRGSGTRVSEWEEWSLQSSMSNIWAPLDSDWMLLGPEWSIKDDVKCGVEDLSTEAVQLSLALLNHHPERSSFTPVLPLKTLPKNSKLLEWLAGLGQSIPVDCHEKEIESILKDPDSDEKAANEEEEENLLTSPKTHFCPIQQEGDAEVQVKDGATFDVDAQPEEVHFLRSPSGALYLPESEENGDGWKGWTKYMVYKTPTSPSPTLETEPASRPASPFTLKFRVIQTEKCCQTDPRLSIENDALSAATTPPLSISSPFTVSFSASSALLNGDDVWRFDADAVTKELVDETKVVGEKTDAKEEEVDGLLNEVWNVAALHDPSAADLEEVDMAVDPGTVDVEECDGTSLPDQLVADVSRRDLEYDLDELWNPFMEDPGQEQVDVCEWIPQPYEEGGNWAEEALTAESWPPPNIPIEYLDDEFFEEIYGSFDSKTSENVATSAGGGKSRRHSRRRRRNSQKQPHVQRRRPCSFFVEGECRRPDCKFSHDLGSITCRFWIESSCFKGDACPFLHGIPAKGNERNAYPNSDAELSNESFGSEDVDSRFHKAALKKFQFDLEADFPSLSQAADLKPRLVTQSRPIPITHGFAAADITGSSQENVPGDNGSCLKRRRKRYPAQRVSALNLVGTSSESSPGDTISVNVTGKRSRKVAKVTTVCTALHSAKKDKLKKTATNWTAVDGETSERRRTKSEHDVSIQSVSTRLRLSSSYKEG